MILQAETDPIKWWEDSVACPRCEQALPGNSVCRGCGASPSAAPYGVDWTSSSDPYLAGLPPRRLLKTIRYYLSPWSNPLSPLKQLNRYRLEGYYERTISDGALAEEWFQHYLGGLGLSDGDTALDHGCGRGRHVGLMLQASLRVAAQDIAAHPWWTRLGACGFQVAPPDCPRLPWRDEAFSLVTDVGVIGHIPEQQLPGHVAEVLRVLKPGGAWVIQEPNSLGWAARVPRRHYGRLHDLATVSDLSREIGFTPVDHWFEGFYAPVLPITINFLRKQCSLRRFELSDHRSWAARLLPEHRRGDWVLRLRKPEKA